LGKGASVRALRQELRDLPNVGPVVRWGAKDEGLLDIHPMVPVLNRRIVFDKHQQLKEFARAEIPSPRVILLEDFDHEWWWVGRLRWLGRRRHHRGGNDIIGPMDADQMRDALRAGEADFAVQFIDKTHEWRVHVFRDEILRIARKVWRGNDPVPGGVAWNAEAGWHFRYNVGLQDTTRGKLSELARRAVQALGMDFGAADIVAVIKPNSRDYFVLEVNSAPGVADNENTLAAYVKAIRKWSDDFDY